FGLPLPLSAWTSTRRASRPTSTQEWTVASTPRRYARNRLKKPLVVNDQGGIATSSPSHPFPSGQAGFWAPAAVFFEVSGGLVRLVAQHQQPSVLLRLVEQSRLLLKHPQGLDVGRHRPWHAQVRRLADEVPGHGARELARSQHEHLAAR